MEILASIGLMWIIKYGSILSFPREYLKSVSSVLKELIECSMCLGFWCGVFFSFISYKNSGLNVELLYMPFIASGACWLFDSLLDLIQELCLFISNKNK